MKYIYPEWQPDQPELTNRLIEAKNVIPGASGYESYGSLSAVSQNGMTNYARGYVRTKDETGNVKNFGGDGTKLYELVNGTFTDRSGTTYALGSEEDWQFVRFNDSSGNPYILAAGYGHKIQVRTIAGTGNFADITQAPQARTISEFQGYVIAGNTYDTTDADVPNRLWRSDYKDHTTWTPATTNQAGYTDLDEGGAIQKIIGLDKAIIFQESSIKVVDISPATGFDIFTAEEGRGLFAKNSAVPFGRGVFYLAVDGLYFFNGFESQPLGKNKFDNFLLTDIDLSFIHRVSATIDVEKSLYMMAYPDNMATTGRPNKIFIYNYGTQRASWLDIEVEMLGSDYAEGYTLEELDAFGTLDTLPYSLDSNIWKGGAAAVLGFSTTHYLSYFTGTTLAAQLDTGDIEPYPMGRAMFGGVKLIGEGATDTITVSAREEQDDTVSYSATTAEYGNVYKNSTLNGKFFRVRVTTSGDFSNLVGLEIDFKKLGMIF